jgi:enamine deaminase RidA (YjgF/YER057c/UK114 family)
VQQFRHRIKISICLLFVVLGSELCFALENQTANFIEKNLSELSITLPKVSAPVANYVPYVKVGKLIFISGQLPMEEGKVKFTGKLGENIAIEDGVEAAKLCALNIIAQLKSAVGSLDKVKRCVKLTGFVNSTSDFTSHPQVINGASDIIVKIFGDKGKHARAAVGVSSLPLGASVEVEAIFEIE